VLCKRKGVPAVPFIQFAEMIGGDDGDVQNLRFLMTFGYGSSDYLGENIARSCMREQMTKIRKLVL